MAGYTKVSIPKKGDGAGAASIKNPTVVLVDVADVTAEPTRTFGNVVTTGDLTLEVSAKAVGIYATPSSIEAGFETSGEVDGKGYKQKLSFEHPGESDELCSFQEANLNRGFIALVTECDGSAKGKVKMYGSKCNPLFMNIEPTNNKESVKSKFTFSQEIAGKFLPGVYVGTMPTLAAETAPEAAAEGL